MEQRVALVSALVLAGLLCILIVVSPPRYVPHVIVLVP